MQDLLFRYNEFAYREAISGTVKTGGRQKAWNVHRKARQDGRPRANWPCFSRAEAKALLHITPHPPSRRLCFTAAPRRKNRPRALPFARLLSSANARTCSGAVYSYRYFDEDACCAQGWQFHLSISAPEKIAFSAAANADLQALLHEPRVAFPAFHLFSTSATVDTTPFSPLPSLLARSPFALKHLHNTA